MHSPGQAILWQIYWRSRYGFLAAAAILLLAVTLCHLLPTHWTIRFEDNDLPAVGWFFGIVCVFLNVMLIGPFAMSGEDTRNYTFAKHMYTLPVRTSVLVAWPLITGCLVVAAVWLINASLVLRATGIAAPLWWPAAGFALFLAIFQALAWTPFAQRWLHGALTVAVIMMPLMIILAVLLLTEAFEARLSEFTVTAVLLALLPVAYLAAYSAVARARRSEFYDWRAWGRFLDWLARRRPKASHPFRSIRRAQLWYECRAHLIVPVFIACLMPFFLWVPALPGDAALGWRLLGVLLIAPVLISLLSGAAVSSLVDPLSKQEKSTFLLARPISSLAIVRSKLILAAIMTASIWILFLGYISLLFLRPEFRESVQSVASRFPLWKAVGYPLLVVLLLVLFSWKSMIETFWVGLTGRKWVEIVYSFALAGLTFAGIGTGLLLTFRPDWQTTALAAVPWLMGVLLVLKFAAGTLVVRGILRSRLATPAGVALMFATWLAVVLALTALALTLLPPEHAPATKIIPGIVLLIPFARLAGAPLALEWNRHR